MCRDRRARRAVSSLRARSRRSRVRRRRLARGALAVVARAAGRRVEVAEVRDEQAGPAQVRLRVAQHRGQAGAVLGALLLVAGGRAGELLDARRLVASGANRAPGASAAKPTSLRNDSTTRAFLAGVSARSAMSLTDGTPDRDRRCRGARPAAGARRPAPRRRRASARRRIAAAEEEALDALVLGLVEQDAVGGLAVAAGAPGLLVVALERAGEVVVDDEADVLLVDAEAERVGRDHQARLAVLHERASGRARDPWRACGRGSARTRRPATTGSRRARRRSSPSRRR